MTTNVFWNHNALGYAKMSPYKIDVKGKQTSVKVHGGSLRTRATNPVGSHIGSFTYFFTKQQMDEFVRFYQEDLNFGKNYFYMMVLTGNGLDRAECLVSKGYKYKLIGAESYDVSFSCHIKRGTNTLQPDPVQRFIIDAMYASSPADNNPPYEASLMNYYEPPVIFQNVGSGETATVSSDETSDYVMQSTWKTTPFLSASNTIDPGDLNGDFI